jgi:hypothetical protein
MPGLIKHKFQEESSFLNPKSEYVKVGDWEGKSLTFILADEVLDKDRPAFIEKRKTRGEKKTFQ